MSHAGGLPQATVRASPETSARSAFGRVEHVERVEGGLWSDYEGRLIYLKGYRDGTDEERVELLKMAIERIWLFGVFSGRA